VELARRVFRSAMLQGPIVPRSDRERALVTVHTAVLHLRPVRLPARTLGWSHTLGLGGSSLVLVGILAASGVLMMLAYQPVPGIAYDSVLVVENAIRFGSLVRGVHYWSANLLVVVVLLHLSRVFLTGGYHGPRQFNWVVGASLLLVVLVNAFTGYLLPWDQLAYWAVTISTGMLAYVPIVGPLLQRVARGGADVGPDTLVLFYTIHTSIVPASLVVLMAFHFWRVRKAGGVVVPPPPAGEPPGDGEKVLFVPNLLMREVAQAFVVLAVVVVLGAAFGAPLGDRANPGLSPNPTKAPWYFEGLQELLVHFHPVFAVLVIPLVAGLFFVLLPYFTDDEEPVGVWLLSRRGRRSAAVAAAAALVATPLAVVLHEKLGATAAGWVTGGLVPLAVVAVAAVGFARLLKRRLALSRNETVQAVAILLATAFAVLTLIGVFFRGRGMALRWPWSA
jgi:quinol-cytochrome oxidoreductase complex cytochrome b subunit